MEILDLQDLGLLSGGSGAPPPGGGGKLGNPTSALLSFSNRRVQSSDSFSVLVVTLSRMEYTFASDKHVFSSKSLWYLATSRVIRGPRRGGGGFLSS